MVLCLGGIRLGVVSPGMYPTNPVDDHGSKVVNVQLSEFFQVSTREFFHASIGFPPFFFFWGGGLGKRAVVKLRKKLQDVGWAAPPCSSAIVT